MHALVYPCYVRGVTKLRRRNDDDEREEKQKNETRFLQSRHPVYLRWLSFAKMCLAWGPKQKLTIIKCKYRNSAATSVGPKDQMSERSYFVVVSGQHLNAIPLASRVVAAKGRKSPAMRYASSTRVPYTHG